MTSRFRPTALLLAVLLVATPAGAKTLKVRRGVTYASIAEEQFGDAALGRLLALHNGGEADATAQVGARIQLPRGRVVRLMVPQRFSDLAIRILDDASLAPLLARVNGKPEAELLPFLEPVVIPAFLELPRVPGESHAAVARRVYGAGAPAWPVELANAETRDHVRVPVIEFFAANLTDVKAEAVERARRRIGKPSPHGRPPTPGPTASVSPQPAAKDPVVTAPAEPVVVTSRPAPEPVARPEPPRRKPAVARLDPRPGPAAPVPSSTPPPRGGAAVESPTAPAGTGPPPSVPEPAEQSPAAAPPPPAPAATLHRPGPAIPEPVPWAPLERVRRSYERGEYHRAEVDARSLLLSGRVPQELRPTAWLLLGLSELARGSEERAVASFQRARAGDPSLDLDPFFYPPKVREAFRRTVAGR